MSVPDLSSAVAAVKVPTVNAPATACASKSVLAVAVVIFNKPAAESTSMLDPVLIRLAALSPEPAETSTSPGATKLPKVMAAPASITTLPAVVLIALTSKLPVVDLSLTPVAPVTVCACKLPSAVTASMFAVALTRLEAQIPVPAVIDNRPFALADCSVMSCPDTKLTVLLVLLTFIKLMALAAVNESAFGIDAIDKLRLPPAFMVNAPVVADAIVERMSELLPKVSTSKSSPADQVVPVALPPSALKFKSRPADATVAMMPKPAKATTSLLDVKLVKAMSPSASNRALPFPADTLMPLMLPWMLLSVALAPALKFKPSML